MTKTAVRMKMLNANGRIVFTVLGAVAELERSLICERAASGLARARKQGKQLGRPKVVVDREQVRQLQKNGHSIRAIAAQLHVSKSLVHGVVSA